MAHSFVHQPAVRFCPQCSHGPLAAGMWTCGNSFCQQADFEDSLRRNRKRSRLSPAQQRDLDAGLDSVRRRRRDARLMAGA